MSTHSAVVSWRLRPEDDFLAGHYSRGHSIGFDGGVTVPGSASPSVVAAPWSVETAADPEELLVASLSACHMLWFLDIARRAGVLVRGYRDGPSARMGRFSATGRVGLTECVLRPEVDCDADVATLEALHHRAHELCNIANSVLTEVRVEPAPVARTVLQGA